METENIFNAAREGLDNALLILNEKEAGLSHSSITEQIIDAKEKIESLKKENPSITESELKEDKKIAELFENIEFWANDSNFDISTPTLKNLDLIYAEAVSFACKEADRLIDQSEEEVLDSTVDDVTEKQILESDNRFRENFNKTRELVEKYLDDNADRFLKETYNTILKRDGAYFDFVEAEISGDDEEFRWNNALADLIFEESLYDKETLAEFNKEWNVSLTPATALYSFIESQKTVYNEAAERFRISSGKKLPFGLVNFIEDLNSIDLENGRFSRENLIRAEDLRNETPNNDLFVYKSKLSHFSPENKERFTQKLVEYAMDSSAVELPEVEYSRENYNKYFNRGNIESPVESLKMGNNQFEKFNQPDRSNLIAAAYLTLKQPSVVIEKETYDEESESFKPLHVYGKSFYRIASGNKRTVESVVVFKNAENIVIGSHNNDIDNFVKQIKTADQIIFADKNVSRVITQLNKEVGNHVSVYGINSEPLNKSYNPDDILSTNNKPAFEENYNYAKKIFKGKTSAIADKVCNFDEMFKWEGRDFPFKKADEALLDSISRMIYDNIDFGELYSETDNSNYDEYFDVSARLDFTDKIARLVLNRELTSLDEIQKYSKEHNAEAALDVKYDYAEDFFKGRTSDMADRTRTFNEIREYVEKDFSDKPKGWRLENIVSRMLYGNIDFVKTSLSGKDFDSVYNAEGYDLRCNLCDDVAKKLVAGSFKDFNDVQKYAESQSKEIAADYLSKDKGLQVKIDLTEKNKKKTMAENKIESRDVTSQDFIRKVEDEEVSLTKEEREQILQEVHPLEMSEKLKMVLTIQQNFENADEKPRTFILTPENDDQGDIEPEDFARLLNKNNIPGQPEISEEQAEAMMRYLRYNDIAVYVDQQDKFHVIDFSEDFTGEAGKKEDTKGIVETVLDELDHGDGTEESYEHQKILTPLIRHYSYKPALASDIMKYLEIDDKKLARELEEWKGGFTDDNDFDVSVNYSHLLKDKFGNLALESGDEIHKYTPDAICELVIDDYNVKIKYDKTLDDVERNNMEESIKQLREVRADLMQVSWEQIEKLFATKINAGKVSATRKQVEKDYPEFSKREIKENTVSLLLNDTIDLKGFENGTDEQISAELQKNPDFLTTEKGRYLSNINGEKWNILETLAETIVQAKDTIDNLSMDKQVQRIYDNEVMKNETYKNCVKEGIIKDDFYLSKLIDPALKIAMDILPENEHDTTSSKLLEMAIKSIEDEYNREGVEPDFKQLETLIKGRDAVNYGIKSIDMLRPTAEEIEIALDNDWDLKDAIKGYTKAGSSELPDGIEVIERIDVMGTFNSDYEAALQAKKAGIQMLPVKNYEKNLDEIAVDYTGLFTDTPENRKFLKIKEQRIEKKQPKNDKEIFDSFITDVQKEYRELKLFRQATINVLKNLPEEEKECVNRELRKRGAVSENSLAVVMKDAVREQLKTNKHKESERKQKKDRDYGFER